MRSLATRDDIAGILDLQEKTLRENGGTLSVRFSREWFGVALGDLPVIVARWGDRVVGYLSSSTAGQAQVPIIQATLEAYPRSFDAYRYGPICVADTERGQNVAAAALMADLRGRLPGREGITFIRRDSVESLRAPAKIGICEVAEFIHEGAAVVVVAQRG